MAFSRNGFGLIVKELGLQDLLSFPKRFNKVEQQEIHLKTKS